MNNNGRFYEFYIFILTETMFGVIFAPGLCSTAPGCTTSSHRPPAWAWATSANTPSASKVGGRFSENRFTEFDET